MCFEEDFGVKFFDWSGNKFVFIEFGVCVVVWGEDLVWCVYDLLEEVEFWKGFEIGEVFVGVDLEIEFGLLLIVLKYFVLCYFCIYLIVYLG